MHRNIFCTSCFANGNNTYSQQIHGKSLICHAWMMYAGIAEVMSLVTNLASGEEAGKEELSGPTDPIRVVMSHTINPAACTVGFTVELLNRMTADVKSLVLRSVVDSNNPLCSSQCLLLLEL